MVSHFSVFILSWIIIHRVKKKGRGEGGSPGKCKLATNKCIQVETNEINKRQNIPRHRTINNNFGIPTRRHETEKKKKIEAETNKKMTSFPYC